LQIRFILITNLYCVMEVAIRVSLRHEHEVYRRNQHGGPICNELVYDI
jgi:hypothetical protein